MAKIRGLDQVLEMENTVYGRQIIPEGEVIPDTGDIAQRVAAFGLQIKENQDIGEFVNRVYDTYQVLDEKGNNMVISKFQYKGKCYEE